MKKGQVIFAALVSGAVGAIAAAGLVHRSAGTGAVPASASGAPNARILALLSRASSSPAIAPRSRSAGCAPDTAGGAALPDKACTPGAVFPSARAREICISGYSQSVRNVPVSLKRSVYGEYGLSYPQSPGEYEADHLIPLELGGSNDIANLWPEPAEPAPGYHEKDLVENYLHDEVCAGMIGLAAAQKQIAADWAAVYETLTPEELAALEERSSRFGN